MQTKTFIKAGVLAIILAGAFIAGWEWMWRSKGFIPTFNDDKLLWASTRAEAYDKNATVFIGSSRIKFDLDIPTWEQHTGEKAVQLALVGTSPLLLLQDLAQDEKFRGRLVVDITEVLFFSQNPVFHKSAKEAIAYYKSQSPAQLVSARAGFALESRLAFLEERRFSLNTLLNDIPFKNRPGVFAFPAFPKGFEWTTRERQTYMSDMFLSNPADVKRQTDIWSMLIMGDKTPPVSGAALEKIFSEIKQSVDRIRGRGGKVVFVRTPSSGPMWDGENQAYPRDKYWDALMQYTGCAGIHFKDAAATGNLVCPEWSHLSREQAVGYTKHLIRELRGKRWF